MKLKTFEQFAVKNLSEWGIQKGSQYAARLELAYDEMCCIFKQSKHHLDVELESLRQENERLKEEILELVELGTDQRVCERIKELEAELEEEKKVVDFYADKNNWEVSRFTRINLVDLSPKEDHEFERNFGKYEMKIGGKRARERQKQRKGERGEKV